MEETNHLIEEKSPYLLQHAHNPVDWYPWGSEAFAKAKREEKPVFLSIGYSTCHWCHVMEEESFEDEKVAQIINQNFVAIKVDREERPDVDSIYMEVCQGLTGRGGWPLTIIMSPEKKPFFAGTYFPKRSKRGRPGLLNILTSVAEKWQDDREKLLETGEKIVQNLRQKDRKNASDKLSAKESQQLLEQTFEQLQASFDDQNGGFGAAPKFPRAHNLLFLLRYSKYNDNDQALEMVEKTLDSLWRGGIYDQIGGGFSRYSTDQHWLVPHFEKMLYDNALLAIAYLEAYQRTDKDDYARVAEEVLDYVLRDMTADKGGFYSAEDADSEGEEGKFYLWSRAEVLEVLGVEKGTEFCDYYDITKGGNFEGQNIPNLIGQTSSKTDIDDMFATAKQKLFAARSERVHPAKDDKILTAWNGLMIAALSLAKRVLGADKYQEQAEKTVEFIRNNLIREDGRLLARYRDGRADYLGYVQDYSFLIWGLIELYQSSFKREYLDLAVELEQDFCKYFWDEAEGGFYLYGSDGEELITRPKKVYDGAVPSGNSIASLNLWRLAQLTADNSLLEKLEQQIDFCSNQIKGNPMGYTAFSLSLFYSIGAGQEITINATTSKQAEEFLEVIWERYLPFTTVALNEDVADGQVSLRICKDFSCQTPITAVNELIKVLD
ncbi:MAG: thioredoxin domain-containing protein [Bacillota bacterium]